MGTIADWEYRTIKLLNGSGSQNLGVNGSSTPQVFTAAIPEEQTWYLTTIGYFMIDPGDMDHDVLASIGSALNTGIDIYLRKNGVDNLLANIKDNVDVMTLFKSEVMRGAEPGFLSSSSFYYGVMNFDQDFRIIGDDETVKAVVNDNLTGVEHIRMYVRVRRPL